MNVYDMADAVYWAVVREIAPDSDKEYIEPDPENIGGTRNTEKGQALYFAIEQELIEQFGFEDIENENI
jgi:hypothetical protein